ncbi:Gfo/Idh/MocA family oxidoreductase [Ruminococcaceae bacterium OttesenSCG-928-A11]|nr:Gfo/Idh/MocA family oxidoreductase [Ruminococcaceae bacterium OttesenSCG-928-A11]
MRIGFLGAGNIAHVVAQTLGQMPGVELYAVAARDGGRARDFAAAHGFAKAYAGYQALVEDSQVELIYLSTTIAHHAAQMRLCIEAGKPVLCEKAFTTTAAEARAVLALAREKKVFVGEAIWPRYMPMASTIRGLVDGGRLGEVVSLQANLGYPVGHLPRLDSPALSGGALLDIGVYPLTFASICFGDEVDSFESSAVFSPSGVDVQSMTQLAYKNGRTAYLFTTSRSLTNRTGTICGTEGYAVVDNINNLRGVTLYNGDNAPVEHIPAPPQISGYEYQFEAAMAAIRAGQTECAQMPHERIIGTMALMDAIRHRWGMFYPGENEERENQV